MTRLAMITAIVVFAAASTATAAVSPTVSTAAGSTSACGAPRDLCEPALNPLGTALPFPLPAPVVTATGPLYGLVGGDDITGLSLGRDRFGAGDFILVSVDSSTVACSPAAGTPDVCSEAGDGQAAADLFFFGSPGGTEPDLLVLDGDGAAAGFPAPPPAFPAFGLDETGGDDIDALDACSVASLAAGGAPRIYFTLAPGSPTLASAGATAADVLTAAAGESPHVAFAAASIGLASGDVIDALSFDGASLRFSLAPGSPTLGSLAATPADILATAAGPAGPVTVAESLPGLLPTDNVDALAIIPDADFDLVNDNCDTCPVASNADQADADGDGAGDLCDACTLVDAGQTATKARIIIRKLDKEFGEQSLTIKGSFVPAVSTPVIDPAVNGVHVQLIDSLAGTLLNVSIPGGSVGSGSLCGAKDGWKVVGAPPGSGGKTIWKYSNRSGSVDPPLCAPQSSRGIHKIVIKDLTSTGAGAFRFLVKLRDATLEADPTAPVSSLRFALALGAEPEDGFAGPAAQAGQCADSVLGGADCKQSPSSGPVGKILCKD